MYTLDYHGDDYGISLNNCKRFIELIEQGFLDSISIISNMGCFDDAIELLNIHWNSFNHKPDISVHLNIMDGYSLAHIDNPLITRKVNDYYVMNCSWMKLLIYSMIPGKKSKDIQSNLTEELCAQIKRVYDILPKGCSLRLDSHVHTHMIPIVFDAMMDALDRLELIDKCEFVRIPREPLIPFIATMGLWPSFSITNVIKNILLSLLSCRAIKKLDNLGITHGIMWGLIMSGKMDGQRVGIIMPKMLRHVDRRFEDKNVTVEILCHPGIVLKEELREEYGGDDLQAFFSENRDIEYDMLSSRGQHL